ncbi:hypothetical protein ABZ864_40880 [Streptomyces sp. NPDC047082]|uniref:hypothetical protein n=1 Tax=Streptomyces sp. NPDC047082 TaxID=3155259 RepID=UPI0033C7A238
MGILPVTDTLLFEATAMGLAASYFLIHVFYTLTARRRPARSTPRPRPAATHRPSAVRPATAGPLAVVNAAAALLLSTACGLSIDRHAPLSLTVEYAVLTLILAALTGVYAGVWRASRRSADRSRT